MQSLLRKFKPASGFAHFLHLAFLLILPAAVFVLVRLDFVQLAVGIIVLSKWRMFAVRPRFWPVNVRANAVDLMVGLSTVAFMTQTGNVWIQLVWAVLYGIWLLAIKPGTSTLMVTVQAGISQLAALMALYQTWDNAPLWGLTLVTGLVCYLAARHFLDAFDEPYGKMLAYVWGYFGAALAWLLSHMLITYPSAANAILAQPVVFLSVIGYGLGLLYYLDHTERLSNAAKWQTLGVVFLVTLALVASLYLRASNLVS